mgnify:CR=1 FL=1
MQQGLPRSIAHAGLALLTIALLVAARPPLALAASATPPTTNAVDETDLGKSANKPKPAKPTTLGWLQSVRLLPHKVRLTAKLDTGAKTSSLHALNIEMFDKNRIEYVRFTLPLKKDSDQSQVVFELPLVKETRVKRHSSDNAVVRPVVELDFCIDGNVHSALFSLDDRSNFNYPVLLGRRFLASRFVVDPAQTFIKRYHCR